MALGRLAGSDRVSLCVGVEVSRAESRAVAPSPPEVIGYQDEGCCVSLSDLLTGAGKPVRVSKCHGSEG